MLRSVLQLLLAPVIAVLAVLLALALEPVRLAVVHLRSFRRTPRINRPLPRIA